MKQCSKCKEFKPEEEFSKDKKNKDGLSYYCKFCNKEHMKKYWNDPEHVKNNTKWKILWRKAHPDKQKAWSKTQQDIKSGKIIKPTKCEHCGKKGVILEGHHEDYNKPEMRIWLCKECHMIADEQRRKREEVMYRERTEDGISDESICITQQSVKDKNLFPLQEDPTQYEKD